jgi:O-6-methylguanine DNA methyltransferase
MNPGSSSIVHSPAHASAGAAAGVPERGFREVPFSTPYGEGTVVVRAGFLAEVRMPALPAHVGLGTGARAPESQSPLATRGRDTPHDAVPDGDLSQEAVATRWAVELSAYFHGGREGWTSEDVDLATLTSSPFRRDVYRALLEVPPGETVSYGELAVLAGHPGAARAVGTAMAANPVPPVVPCHRVIRGDGTPGRYGDDDRWKLVLLELERSP